MGWGGVGRKTYACVNLALVSKALSLMATGRERLQWHDVTHAPLHHAGAAIVATRTAGLQPACGRCCGCCGCRSSTLVHAIDGGDVLLHKSIILALQSKSMGCDTPQCMSKSVREAYDSAKVGLPAGSLAQAPSSLAAAAGSAAAGTELFAARSCTAPHLQGWRKRKETRKMR